MRGRIKQVLTYIVIFLAILGVFATIYFLVRMLSSNGLYVNTNRAAVIKQMQSLNRYETASYTIEKIIDAGTSGSGIQQFLFGDKLLLVAHGNVIAGFDFSKLTDNSVIVKGETVTLNLPAPQILGTSLDESQTRVYDRSTGLLAKGDKDLESKAREAAQSSITNAACQENILDSAARNGRSQLTTLLKVLGFTTVIINIPSASC